MSGADFTALQAKFGKRIDALIFDNHQIALVDYPNDRSVSIDDITVETIGGTDYIVIPQSFGTVDRVTKTLPTYKVYHTAESLQSVVIMDEPFEKFRVDPVVLL